MDRFAIASIIGNTLATAYLEGGERTRTEIYDILYRPFVIELERENADFGRIEFAAAVGTAEQNYLSRKG